MVLALQGASPDSDARTGFTRLCESYWYPVYAFIRGTVYNPQVAEDLTQEFFLTLITKETFERVAPERGRYLFVAFTNRGSLLRVISARDMNRRERSAYADHEKEAGAWVSI
jgi:DNA-directed RNA polymerase specialized sigma24 family protein